MTSPVIPMARAGATKQRKRQAPKGRPVIPQALAEVQELMGSPPWRHDLLIEYLHRINDRYHQLGSPHMAALARLLGLAGRTGRGYTGVTPKDKDPAQPVVLKKPAGRGQAT